MPIYWLGWCKDNGTGLIRAPSKFFSSGLAMVDIQMEFGIEGLYAVGEASFLTKLCH